MSAIKFKAKGFSWQEVSVGKHRAIECIDKNVVFALRMEGSRRGKVENIHECSDYNKNQVGLYIGAAESIVNNKWSEEGSFDFGRCEILWKQSDDGRW